MRTWWIKKTAAILAVTAVAILFFGAVVMFLWNAVVPDVFGTTALTYWQAVALLLLTQVLFRGMGRWRSHHRHGDHDRWKHKLEEKLSAMAPDERERFKAEWERRCGCVGKEEGKGDK
jgi:membrane protein implicated in regulation of membrane protease activity